MKFCQTWQGLGCSSSNFIDTVSKEAVGMRFAHMCSTAGHTNPLTCCLCGGSRSVVRASGLLGEGFRDGDGAACSWAGP